MLNNKSIPSVKVAVKTFPPSTILFEGYLMKQKHGKCKAWLKRYFILYEKEIRYYKSKSDTSRALAVITLDHYNLVLNSHSLTSLLNQKQPQRKQTIFCLVSDDTTKYNWPDYFLQAADAIEYRMWINSLEDRYLSHLIHNSSSVLDKWLDRLKLPDKHSSLHKHHVPETLLSSSLKYNEESDSLPSSPQSFVFTTNSSVSSLSIRSNHSSSTPPPILLIKNHRSRDSLGSRFQSLSSSEKDDFLQDTTCITKLSKFRKK
ncbi:uncharacterized protein BX663DRAFT_505446 [Cokeromyces recurvatus]|uniref:uncharacterized protein n=1 Tax=Cokeromyces recurvatus TaxID=90255 RepID=UPI00222056DB|nr:uncharacterized protein BX663DRAFT_505446 [Cokeromyces recurvatus]KAI7903847.1 hypothetical protein BX663DRAFT_505446 [Cokeromyces recurvatus]